MYEHIFYFNLWTINNDANQQPKALIEFFTTLHLLHKYLFTIRNVDILLLIIDVVCRLKAWIPLQKLNVWILVCKFAPGKPFLQLVQGFTDICNFVNGDIFSGYEFLVCWGRDMVVKWWYDSFAWSKYSSGLHIYSFQSITSYSQKYFTSFFHWSCSCQFHWNLSDSRHPCIVCVALLLPVSPSCFHSFMLGVLSFHWDFVCFLDVEIQWQGVKVPFRINFQHHVRTFLDREDTANVESHSLLTLTMILPTQMHLTKFFTFAFDIHWSK